MTRAIAILLLSAALGFVAFWTGAGTRQTQCGAPPAHRESLDWLKSEFSLDDSTFERVRALHEAYLPICEDLCRRVAENRRRTETEAGRDEAYSPALDAALREAADLRLESQRLYLRHAHAVAAAMSPEQGQRYAAMMKKRVFGQCECGSGMCLH